MVPIGPFSFPFLFFFPPFFSQSSAGKGEGSNSVFESGEGVRRGVCMQSDRNRHRPVSTGLERTGPNQPVGKGPERHGVKARTRAKQQTTKKNKEKKYQPNGQYLQITAITLPTSLHSQPMASIIDRMRALKCWLEHNTRLGHSRCQIFRRLVDAF